MHADLKTAVAMAVRNYKVEEPVYKEVQDLELAIRKSVHPTRFYTNYDIVGMNKAGHPTFVCFFKHLPGLRDDLKQKYNKYFVQIEPSYTMADGYFSGNMIALTYNPNAYFPKCKMKELIVSLNSTLSHELRHLVDDMNGTFAVPWKTIDPNKDYAGYYNSEHEVEARVTALFLIVNKLIMVSAKKLLKDGFVDTVTKTHNKILKDFDSFFKYLKAIDKEMRANVFGTQLSVENYEEVEGKSREFWKLMREDYGMALRSIESTEVTEDMKAKWLALMESTKSQIETKTDIKKIVQDDAVVSEKPSGAGKRTTKPNPTKKPVKNTSTRSKLRTLATKSAKQAVKKVLTKTATKKVAVKPTAKPVVKKAAVKKAVAKPVKKTVKPTKPVKKAKR